MQFVHGWSFFLQIIFEVGGVEEKEWQVNEEEEDR